MAHISSGLTKLSGAATAWKERRRWRRDDIAGFHCNRGSVLDISPRGMRIRCTRRWAEGQVRQVTITNGSATMTLPARCVWCRQDAMFTHAVGLAFEHTEPSQGESLERMMRSNPA